MNQWNTECFPKRGYTTQSTRRRLRGSSEEKRIYILFAMLCKNVCRDVENSCSRTECGVRKHFQEIPVFGGLQLCTVCIQKKEHYCNTERSLCFMLDGNLPFSRLPSGTISSFIMILRTPWMTERLLRNIMKATISWVRDTSVKQDSELWDELMHYAFFQGIS